MPFGRKNVESELCALWQHRTKVTARRCQVVLAPHHVFGLLVGHLPASPRDGRLTRQRRLALEDLAESIAIRIGLGMAPAISARVGRRVIGVSARCSVPADELILVWELAPASEAEPQGSTGCPTVPLGVADRRNR